MSYAKKGNTVNSAKQVYNDHFIPIKAEVELVMQQNIDNGSMPIGTKPLSAFSHSADSISVFSLIF